MGLAVAAWFAVVRLTAGSSLRLFLATGILGGFTTFSAFSLDTVALIERGEAGAAAVYVVASVGLSILGLAVGLWAMRAMARLAPIARKYAPAWGRRALLMGWRGQSFVSDASPLC